MGSPSVFLCRIPLNLCPHSTVAVHYRSMTLSRAEAGRLGYQKSKTLRDRNKEERLKAKKATHKKTCPHCARPIPFEKRRNTHCSHSCAAAHINHGEVRIPSTCSVCGLPLGKNAKEFCSGACAIDAAYRVRVVEWQAGVRSGGTWRGVYAFVRRWLLETFGEHCSTCNWSERNPATGKVPLQVDHISGDPNDHRPQNLRLLCPNCHSLTPTFGGLNRGKGRKQRYAPVA